MKDATDHERPSPPDPEGDAMFAEVYDELRRMAGRALGGRDLTLQPTALVHEAYCRFAQAQPDYGTRTHFLALAGRAMRQLLANFLRDRAALKRGGGCQAVTLSGLALGGPDQTVDLQALHEILEKLAEIDPRQSRIVEMRFFAGLTMQEIASVLKLSLSTVEADWRHARSWMKLRLAEHEATKSR